MRWVRSCGMLYGSRLVGAGCIVVVVVDCFLLIVPTDCYLHVAVRVLVLVVASIVVMRTWVMGRVLVELCCGLLSFSLSCRRMMVVVVLVVMD
jgi:hypothetical protein